MLIHNRNMNKIKKECFKNMIAGPSLIDQQLGLGKQTNSYSFNHKDSFNKQSGHKNSLVGPCYNSDTEDQLHQEHSNG